MENIDNHLDGEKNCILLVDDDFINRELMKNIFAADYTFMEAENGKQGLAAVEAHGDRFCAIFLDVNMPVMSGIELLSHLHAQGIPEKTPVFLITSHEEQDIARAAYDMGVMDVITKPVSPFIIQRRVSSVVELFRARERLRAEVSAQSEQLRENADRIDELHRNTIEALASAIEFRDVESGEHTNRIYAITKKILADTDFGAGYTAAEIENMAIGSIMHDVGKIAISDIILNKPGRLTRDEFEIMKMHTVKGGDLMAQLAQLQSHPAYAYATDIARHHHERYDGRGYPDGLKGEEISVWSQAVSVADVYDALISPRVYKRAFTPDEAVEMIKEGECGVFNPHLLACFLQVEPEIRAWYASAPTSRVAEMDNISEQRKAAGGDVTDVLTLTAAVHSAYDMVICANLTKNTYHMLDYDRFQTHRAGLGGKFDDLIAAGISSVPACDRETFAAAFGRESLIKAHAEGKKSVRLKHLQYGDDGILHKVATSVLFVVEPRTGDLREITLARYIDDDVE